METTHSQESAMSSKTVNTQKVNEPAMVDIEGAAKVLGCPVTSVLHLKGVAKLAEQTDEGKRWKVSELEAIAQDRQAKADAKKAEREAAKAKEAAERPPVEGHESEPEGQPVGEAVAA
jgi:hypothetical protein